MYKKYAHIHKTIYETYNHTHFYSLLFISTEYKTYLKNSFHSPIIKYNYKQAALPAQFTKHFKVVRVSSYNLKYTCCGSYTKHTTCKSNMGGRI